MFQNNIYMANDVIINFVEINMEFARTAKLPFLFPENIKSE
jgi:hypothetical protein